MSNAFHGDPKLKSDLLDDGMFEGLPKPLHLDLPSRFMSAIQPGADLTLVGTPPGPPLGTPPGPPGTPHICAWPTSWQSSWQRRQSDSWRTTNEHI